MKSRWYKSIIAYIKCIENTFNVFINFVVKFRMEKIEIGNLKDAENSDEQRTRGRRPNGLDMVTRNVNLERDMVEWAQDQPGGLSPTLRSLMRQAHASQVRPNTEEDNFLAKRKLQTVRLRRERGATKAESDPEFVRYMADLQGVLAGFSEDDRELFWFMLMGANEKRIDDDRKTTTKKEHYKPSIFSRDVT